MDNSFSLDLALLPKELRFLLEMMKVGNDNSLLINSMTNIDWNRFLELARHHRVYPLLYKKLKEIDEKLVPPYVVQSLYEEYHKNTFRMLHLSGETECLSRLFTESKIRTLFLKGPVLGFELYGDISNRTSADIDILIPINDLDHMEEILLKIGYEKNDYILSVLNDWKWRHHHATYFHPNKRIKIEIHWRLNPGPAKEPSFDELWERRRISSLTSYPVYFLGREDLFLFLVTHGARHGWSRLRWLADIDQIVSKGLDWKALILLLKKFQYLHVGGQALILVSQLLNTTIIAEINSLTVGIRSRRLAQDALFYFKKMVNLHTNPIPEEVARYHRWHLFSLMSNQQKLLFIMSFLYPYPEDAEILPLPEKLHFLYFPLRPLLWIWRKTRKYALP